MKKILALVITVVAMSVKAQMGQAVADFVFTNSAVDVEAFRGLKADKYIIAFTYAKDLTTNAGVLITYDKAFTPGNRSISQADMLNGGFTLKDTIYPLRHWNPNSSFALTVGAYEEAGVATSGPNNGGAVNVVGTYVDYQYKSLEIGLLYQNRTEQDSYSGNYIGTHLGWRF